MAPRAGDVGRRQVQRPQDNPAMPVSLDGVMLALLAAEHGCSQPNHVTFLHGTTQGKRGAQPVASASPPSRRAGWFMPRPAVERPPLTCKGPTRSVLQNRKMVFV